MAKVIKLTEEAARQRILGPEPSWTSTPVDSGKIIDAHNWYNYMLDTKAVRQIFREYLIVKGNPTAVEQFDRLNDHWLITGLAATLRMVSRGRKLTDAEKKRWAERFREMLDKADPIEVPSTDVTRAPTIGPESDVIAHFDELIDNASTIDVKTFSPYTIMNELGVKPTIAVKVSEHYKPYLQELKIAYVGKDPQINEAYRTATKKQIQKLGIIVEMIIVDGGKWSTNNRVARKPRKIKTKTADQLTKKIKYQVDDHDLQIKSINPTTIIGAREVWTFHTGKRVLHKYVADGPGGLQISRSSIVKFDPNLSVQKKVRKPREILSKITSGGIKSVNKDFENIKAKVSPCNGRINEQVLLVRAFKQ